MSETIRVVAAAVNHEGKVWTLPAPARHHNVLRYMVEHGVKTPIRAGTEDQGFVRSDGKFVSRSAALRIARQADQVGDLIGSILTSEDLW